MYIPDYKIENTLNIQSIREGNCTMHEYSSQDKYQKRQDVFWKPFFIEKAYPMFEEYHVSRKLDRIIDILSMKIQNIGRRNKTKIEFETSNKDWIQKSFDLNTLGIDFSLSSNIEYSGYAFDIRRKDFIEVDTFIEADCTTQIPMFFFVYPYIDGENAIQVLEKEGKRIIKFKIYLEEVLKNLDNNLKIKSIVRHELHHVIQRLSPLDHEDKFMIKKNEISEEDYKELDQKYGQSIVQTAIRICYLFSPMEMSARINELFENIKNLSVDTIQRLYGSKNIKYDVILSIMRDNLNITLIDKMESSIDDIKENQDLVECLTDINYICHFWKTSTKSSLQNTLKDNRNHLINTLDHVMKKFEVDCMKEIYHVLSKNLNKIDENIFYGLNGMISIFGEHVIFDSMQIYYTYAINKLSSF